MLRSVPVIVFLLAGIITYAQETVLKVPTAHTGSINSTAVSQITAFFYTDKS